MKQQNRGLYIAFFIFAIIFLLGVVIQIFIAGLAIFNHPVHWLHHKIFVHFFDKTAMIMLLLALIGNMPKWAKVSSGLLVVLVFSMYFTANFIATSPWVSALHPVIAIALFIISLKAVQKAAEVLKGKEMSS